MAPRLAGLVAGSVAIVAALAGCGSDSSSASSSVANSGALSIKNFAFSPDPVTIKAGTQIVWTNQDASVHTVVSDSGDPAAFDTGNVAVGGGASKTVTLTTPGTYKYHCGIHQYMTGTIIITG